MEVFGLLAPEQQASSLDSGEGSSSRPWTTGGVPENEPPSPTGSMRSTGVCSEGGGAGAGGKRSRIPTLGNVTLRAGFTDKTNTAN